MSDAINDAASAFDRDMGGSSAPAQPGIRDRASAPEPIFGNSDGHESDLIAGGDHEDDVQPKKRARKPEPEARDEDDEDDFDPLALLREEGDGEDDDDDADADADADGEDDDDDEDDDDKLMERVFSVVVDGEETEMTVKEALDSGIRTQTFHKRLNQLDGFRKELGEHAQKVVEDRQRYDTLLGEAEEILTGLLPDEPDWDKLFSEDPQAARNLQKQYDGYKGKIEEIRAKRAQTAKDEAEREQRETAEFARNEFPKFAAQARWQNKEQMEKDIKSMRKTALTSGFSEQEAAEVYDHRMLTVLLKASKYDRMMAAKPKSVKKGKTPVKPGAGSKGTARRGFTGAQNKLSRSGSVEDAADVFAQVIKR